MIILSILFKKFILKSFFIYLHSIKNGGRGYASGS